MNIYAAVRSQVLAALDELETEGVLPAGLDMRNVEVSPPREAAHGDLASNAAMVLAKAAGKKPREIAEPLAQRLAKLPDVARTEVAGPGFINITFHPRFWHRIVKAIQAQRRDFGQSALGGNVPTNVEYVSANPTGPMHVGHCRGAVFGDALANLLEFAGYKVTREYYINDAGAQVDILARSAYLRYREALGENIGEIPVGLYPGDYLKPVGAALAAEHGPTLLNLPEERWLPLVREAAIAAMLVQIKQDLAALAIEHDVFFSEQSLTRGADGVRATIDELRKRGLIFKGRLDKPKGHDDGEWEDREQTLFKSTSFGDDVDRAILKSDGSYTYFAADMAYHNDKLKRGFKHLINVFGADHVGYITRMKAAVAALSNNTVDLDIKVCQLVKLFRAGEPVRMSKRAGTFVTLRDVVDEVGRDAVRFMMLYRKNDAPLDFDLAKVLEQTKDNPVFYVQYAHARAHSVFRNAREVFPNLVDPLGADIVDADLALLGDSGEIDLIRKLAAFPPVVEAAARAHEPHRLAFYLHDLAATFHSQWTRGNESPQLRFIQAADGKVTAARLALIDATREVLGAGLAILGVHAPDEMR